MTGRLCSAHPTARIAALLGACAILLTQSGCLTGIVYEHTTRPLDIDFDETPSGVGSVQRPARGGSWKTLRLPTSLLGGPDLTFDWGDIGVEQAMHEAKLERVHYADLETRSFLRIWTQRWLHVYGEPSH